MPKRMVLSAESCERARVCVCVYGPKSALCKLLLWELVSTPGSVRNVRRGVSGLLCVCVVWLFMRFGRLCRIY